MNGGWGIKYYPRSKINLIFPSQLNFKKLPIEVSSGSGFDIWFYLIWSGFDLIWLDIWL
jgi:hypothetical protein